MIEWSALRFKSIELINHAEKAEALRVRDIPHPDPASFTLASALYALGDPVRLRIMGRLLAVGGGEMACGDAAGDGLPKATQSFHFRTLRDAGLVTTRREGKRYLSRIRPEFEMRFPGLLSDVLRRAGES
jgi:DNA-binding transcriptional ArsR family regulator